MGLSEPIISELQKIRDTLKDLKKILDTYLVCEKSSFKDIIDAG